MACTKTNTQNDTKHVQNHDATDILQEMLSYRLRTVNDIQWEFKPVLSYSKPHTFSTFYGVEKERKCIKSLQPGHLEAEQNDRIEIRSKIKQKLVKKREFNTHNNTKVFYLWKLSQVRGRMAKVRKP